MNDDPVGDTDLESLMQLMDPDVAGSRLWDSEELGAILAHQLAAPLECDLKNLDENLPERLDDLNSAGGPPLRTFHDLLHHPRPPADLLALTKRFAKSCRSHPSSPLPDEIATILYFSSIVVAMTKCGDRITKMDDRSLVYSLHWALKQTWLDPMTRALLQEGCSAIDLT